MTKPRSLPLFQPKFPFSVEALWSALTTRRRQRFLGDAPRQPPRLPVAEERVRGEEASPRALSLTLSRSFVSGEGNEIKAPIPDTRFRYRCRAVGLAGLLAPPKASRFFLSSRPGGEDRGEEVEVISGEGNEIAFPTEPRYPIPIPMRRDFSMLGSGKSADPDVSLAASKSPPKKNADTLSVIRKS